MFTYNTQTLLNHLMFDVKYYEGTEEGENVKKLYEWVKNNSQEGITYLSPQQREVYICGNYNETLYFETMVDSY